MEIRITEIALAQLARPVGILKGLIDEECMTTRLYKLARKIDQRMLGEVEVVEIDIERALA